MRVALLSVVLTLTSLAAAEPADRPPPLASNSNIAVALAVNPPLRWKDGDGVAISGYLGFARHHTIRLNYASFANHGDIAFNILALALGGDGDEGVERGRLWDVGIGWQYYPRSMWDGFSIELGIFRRTIDTSTEYAFGGDPAFSATKSSAFAGRALFGWSWLWSERWFVATAFGLSAAHYTGTLTTADSLDDPQYMTSPIDRIDAAAEFYVRFGVAFGL